VTPQPSLFLWIPRSGGTSIWGTIENNNASTQRVGVAKDRIFCAVTEATTFQHCHIPALLDAGVFLEAWLESRFKFAFVRNPWARLVSVFHHLKQGRDDQKEAVRGLSFGRFIEQACAGDIPPVGIKSRDGLSYANPQVDWLTDSEGNWIPDFIGKTEHLKADWRHVKGQTGLKGNIPGRANRSKHAHYQDYYTERWRAMVAARYQQEIDLWRYTF